MKDGERGHDAQQKLPIPLAVLYRRSNGGDDVKKGSSIGQTRPVRGMAHKNPYDQCASPVQFEMPASTD